MKKKNLNIALKLTGPDSEKGLIRLDDFLSELAALQEALESIDKELNGKAADYRHFYRINPLKRPNRDKPYNNLTTPDAIHLATAVIYNCDEFWTMDGLNPTSDKYESIKPLWLNNKVANDSIIVTAPAMPQGTLPLGIEAEPTTRRFKLGE